MKKFLKETYPFIIGWIIAIAMLYIGRSQGYEKGHEVGFSKGLDTAGVVLDKLLDSAKVMITELEAMQVESFTNHSEIKP